MRNKRFKKFGSNSIWINYCSLFFQNQQPLLCTPSFTFDDNDEHLFIKHDRNETFANNELIASTMP
jgi:hypothetical protein